MCVFSIHLQASTSNKSTARKRPSRHRTFYSLSTIISHGIPGCQTSSSMSSILDSNSFVYLPLCTNRHSLPINTFRPPQHTTSHTNSHNTNLPSIVAINTPYSAIWPEGISPAPHTKHNFIPVAIFSPSRILNYHRFDDFYTNTYI
jgi:hypothetical protein